MPRKNIPKFNGNFRAVIREELFTEFTFIQSRTATHVSNCPLFLRFVA